MQYTRPTAWWPIVAWRLHLLVLVSCVGLALLGRMPDSVGGWESYPPAVYRLEVVGRRRRAGAPRSGRSVSGGHAPGAGLADAWRRSWRYSGLTWSRPVWRGLALGVVWGVSGQSVPLWLLGVPGVVWLAHVITVGLPWLGRQPEWMLWLRGADWGERWTLRLAVGWALTVASSRLGAEGLSGGAGLVPDLGAVAAWSVSGCLLFCAPRVTVQHDEPGRCYRAEIRGDFTLAVADDDPFRLRLMVLFLRLLEDPTEHRGSRRTRDGRTPFVRQQDLGRALGIVQPDLSRWEQYWLAGNWRALVSQSSGELLTRELQQMIIKAWARVPGWGVEAVQRLLVAQGVAVTESQVREAAHASGWQMVRERLARQCVHQADELRLREGWLLGELLRQIEFLLGKVEAREGLTPEEQVDLAAWQKGATDLGLVAPPPLKTLPWLVRVERVLFGQWEAVTDERVHCPYCGSDQVVCKSRKPREKRYYDEARQLQTVAVQRYYCRNPQCAKGSFTNLPAGLVPYSRHRTEVHLLTLQMYGWGYSTYRRTGEAMGVASLTAYRWVSAWGYALLPVAAVFGVVKSSGVVGVDEKYVLVPKNGKPPGKMRRWMYVYFAVDVYTYDLLHIALFPHNNEASAQAFLLALRGKGYHPRVVVTDLRQDYGPVVAQVFPRAEHHECLFHALQNVQAYVKEVYGDGYAESHPEAVVLKERIYAIFAAKTKRTADKRYGEVMGMRAEYVQARPAAEVIFAFLERHWPKLVNAIESDLIPTTNNTVELVIRRFDQHYQSFCGFESMESAQVYLGVFEKLYRFTPFSVDAQPAIRGRSPLELAGYDIRQLPMTTLASGQSIIWPTEVAHVPIS
jgi:transposase-like protein